MMIHTQDARRDGRASWLLVLLVSLLLIAGVLGAYGLYTVRAQQNTRKLLAQAREAAAAEHWETAVIAYRQYVQRRPEDVEALRAYADVLLESIKTSPEALGDTVRILRRLVGLEPGDAEAIGKLTGLYLALREYELAEELVRRWVTIDPQSADATLALAVTQSQLREPERAVEVLAGALERNPDQPALYPLLIKLLTELGRLQEAADRLEDAMRVDPGAAAIQLAAFVFHERRGDAETAEGHLREALQSAPDSLEVILTAAAYYLSDDRLAEVEVLLNDAAQRAPNSRRVLALRATWALKKGDTAALVATADDLLRHAGDADIDLIAQAAELYLRADKLDGADECLARLETLPTAPERLGANLDRLKGARAFQGGQALEAVARFLAALRREPTSVQAVRLLAAAYVQTGDLDAATETFRKLIALVPTDAGVRLRFAELGWQQGWVSEVREAVGVLPEATDVQRLQADLIRLACELRQTGRGRRDLQRGGELARLRERFASITPPDPATVRWLARCLVLTGQPDDAVALVHAGIMDTATRIGLGADLGRLLISAQFAGRALALADELLQEAPDAVKGHALRIEALGAMGRFDEASALADQSGLPAEAQGSVLETLADASWAAGQSESAQQSLRRAAGLVTTSLSVRQKLARRSADRKDALQWAQEIRTIEGEAGLHWRYELASALLRLEPTDESVARSRELLERCLADRPQWSSARLLLGYGHELSGRLQEAAEAYQTAIADQPTLRSKSVIIRLVGLLRRLGRFAEADTLLNTLAAAAPEEPEVLRLRIEQQLRERDVDSALTTAEQLIQLRPDDPAWVAGTADLYLRIGNPVQAEAITRPALARFPDSVPILWSLAQALIAQGRGDEAQAEVADAAAAAGDAPHLLLCAHVLAQLGRFASAERMIADAVKLDPEDPGVWAASADFWGRRGERSRQIDCARKAIELRGDDPTESLALARLLASSESADELAEAGQIVRHRLGTDPDDASALLLKVKLALTEDATDLTGAQADLRRALTADPRSPEVYRLLAAVQVRSGESGTAAETVATGLAFVPDNMELLLSAGEIRCHRGEYRQAIEPLQRVLEFSPRSLHALRLLATAFEQTGQVDRAIARLEETAPSDAMTLGELLILARLYEIKGELSGAERLLVEAQERNGESGEAFRRALQFYARRGDFESVHAMTVKRRAEYPEDVASLLAAGGVLGAQSIDETLHETAIGWLEEIASTQTPSAAAGLFQSGTCYYQRGDLNVAESKFLQAMRRAPEAWEPVNAVAWLYAVDLERPTEARAVINTFLESGGRENAALMDTHGVALLRVGELDLARRKLERCLRLVGETSTKAAANYHLGLVLREMGRAREGLVHIEEAVRLAKRLGGLTDKERGEAERFVAERAPAAQEPSRP